MTYFFDVMTNMNLIRALVSQLREAQALAWRAAAAEATETASGPKP